MASEQRTRALLEGAGFVDVRTEELPVRFAFRDLDAYERWVIDVAGSFAMVVRDLPEDERGALRERLGEAFGGFTVARGYEIPGVALCAAAS